MCVYTCVYVCICIKWLSVQKIEIVGQVGLSLIHFTLMTLKMVQINEVRLDASTGSAFGETLAYQMLQICI